MSSGVGPICRLANVSNGSRIAPLGLKSLVLSAVELLFKVLRKVSASGRAFRRQSLHAFFGEILAARVIGRFCSSALRKVGRMFAGWRGLDDGSNMHDIYGYNL